MSFVVERDAGMEKAKAAEGAAWFVEEGCQEEALEHWRRLITLCCHGQRYDGVPSTHNEYLVPVLEIDVLGEMCRRLEALGFEVATPEWIVALFKRTKMLTRAVWAPLCSGSLQTRHEILRSFSISTAPKADKSGDSRECCGSRRLGKRFRHGVSGVSDAERWFDVTVNTTLISHVCTRANLLVRAAQGSDETQVCGLQRFCAGHLKNKHHAARMPCSVH